MAADIPTPCQRVRTDTTVLMPNGDYELLHAGTIIKAISKEYLPKHCDFGDYDESFFTAAFTPIGIVRITKYSLDWDIY